MVGLCRKEVKVRATIIAIILCLTPVSMAALRPRAVGRAPDTLLYLQWSCITYSHRPVEIAHAAEVLLHEREDVRLEESAELVRATLPLVEFLRGQNCAVPTVMPYASNAA